MEPQAERIIDKILHDTREKANSIIEEARKSAEMMLEQQRELARQKASEEVSSILRRAETEVEVAMVTEATEASKKASWMILSEKERLVINVLDEVKTRLVAFSKSKKYVPFLQRIIVDAGTVLGGGRLEFQLNEKDSTLPLKLTTLAKTITKKTGTETKLQLSKEKIEASGGVVVKTFDGKILVDNTFEAILKQRERDLRLRIAKILFK